MKCYPEIKEKEEMRKIIGRYGLTGKQQVRFVFFFVFFAARYRNAFCRVYARHGRGGCSPSSSSVPYYYAQNLNLKFTNS